MPHSKPRHVIQAHSSVPGALLGWTRVRALQRSRSGSNLHHDPQLKRCQYHLQHLPHRRKCTCAKAGNVEGYQLCGASHAGQACPVMLTDHNEVVLRVLRRNAANNPGPHPVRCNPASSYGEQLPCQVCRANTHVCVRWRLNQTVVQ